MLRKGVNLLQIPFNFLPEAFGKSFIAYWTFVILYGNYWLRVIIIITCTGLYVSLWLLYLVTTFHTLFSVMGCAMCDLGIVLLVPPIFRCRNAQREGWDSRVCSSMHFMFKLNHVSYLQKPSVVACLSIAQPCNNWNVSLSTPYIKILLRNAVCRQTLSSLVTTPWNVVILV